MIDTSLEIPLSLSQAAKLPNLPIRRRGKRPHVATLHRWAVFGIGDIKLETIMCGKVRCTTAAAIQRFFERLTAQANGTTPVPAPLPRHRREAIARAEAVLDAAGI